MLTMLHNIVGDMVGRGDGPEDGGVVGRADIEGTTLGRDDGLSDGLVGSEDGEIDGDMVTHASLLLTE